MTVLKKQRCAGRQGFSLIEALMSSFIFCALLAALYAAMADADRMKKVQDTYARMDMDARRALLQMSTELRMSGRVANPAPGQPSFPYTFVNGGALGTYNPRARHSPANINVDSSSPAYGDNVEISFLIPHDNDGDGLLTSSATGKIEWSEYHVSYVIVTGPDGINRLERWEDGTRTDVIAMYAERVVFDTIKTDPSLSLHEVGITLYMARPISGTSTWVETYLTTKVTMRNSDGLHEEAPSPI